MGNQCSPRSAGCATRFVNKFVLENHQRKLGSPCGGCCHVSSARLVICYRTGKSVKADRNDR